MIDDTPLQLPNVSNPVLQLLLLVGDCETGSVGFAFATGTIGFFLRGEPTRTRRSTDTTIRGANNAMPDTDASEFSSYSTTMLTNTTCERNKIAYHDSFLKGLT
jgi:hypothetical protein